MWRHRIISFLAILAITLGLNETACRLFVETRLLETFNQLDSNHWRRITAPIPDFDPNRTDFDYGLPQVAHPYFGHIATPEVADSTDTPNYISRFENDEVYRKAKTADDFVIGFFGGSVAENLARWESQSKTFESRLKEKIPTLKERKFKIINFAAGRGSQPRQFFIASLYWQSLDLAINLEGYNELNQRRPIQYPPYFPGPDLDRIFFQRTQGDMTLSHEFILSAAKYGRLKREVFINPPRSSLIRSIKLAELIILNKKLKKIESLEPDQDMPDRLKMRSSTFTELVKFWHEQSQNQSQLLARKNVPAFFFQQPIPAVPGSKKMTDEELAFREPEKHDPQIWDPLTKAYVAAEEVFSRYASVNFRSLVWIFRNEPRTVYVDFCCHLNPLGHRLVSEAMAEYISTKLICPKGKPCYLRNLPSH